MNKLKWVVIGTAVGANGGWFIQRKLWDQRYETIGRLQDIHSKIPGVTNVPKVQYLC